MTVKFAYLIYNWMGLDHENKTAHFYCCWRCYRRLRRLVTSITSYTPIASKVDSAYLAMLVYSATIWGVFGLVNGALQFYLSLGETPTMVDIDTERLFFNPEIFRNFDYIRMGSKLLYIF